MSTKQVGSKSLKFVPHPANRKDPSDLPFRLLGHKFRWVAARSTEDRYTRPWVVLRKSDIPEDVIQELKSRNVNAFRDGETIRWGENVLAYASNEEVAKLKAANEREAYAQRELIGANSANRPGIVHKKGETSVTRMGPGDNFND